MPQPPTGREVLSHNNFDFLRFFLAALVIFSHSFPLLDGSKEWEPLYRFTGRQVEAGAVAVDGFFIISGFLIAQSWVRGEACGTSLRNASCGSIQGLPSRSCSAYWW